MKFFPAAKCAIRVHERVAVVLLVSEFFLVLCGEFAVGFGELLLLAFFGVSFWEHNFCVF